MADCWQPQACSGLQNQSYWPSSAFRDLVQAFPKSRQHVARISKPHSAGTSPSTSATKRRTTTTAVMPQRNSVYHHRPAPAALLASTTRQNRRSRPMSWHPAGHSTPHYIPPSTTSTAASMNMSAMALPPSLNDAPLCGDDTNMLPPSYPLSSDVPVSNDSFPSLDPLSEQTFLSMGGSQIDQSAWDATVPELATTSQPLSDGWTFDMMSMNNNMPSLAAPSYYESVPSSDGVTGPSTPDLLPIQPHEDYNLSKSETEPETEPEFTKDENELVGMGLYNQPESFQSSTQGMLGKGLKLEETFTPSPDNDDNKDAEEDDDDSNDEQMDPEPKQALQGFEPIKQPVKPPMNLLSQAFLFDDDSFEQHAVSEAQQLVSLNQPCTNYGYEWI